MSSNAAKATVLATAITTLAFTFSHGSVVEINNGDFSEETLAKFLQYGIKQKLQDSYSGVKDSAEAEKNLLALVERLKNGEWTASRVAGTSSQTTKLISVVATISGKSIAEVTALIEALDDAQIKALKARPQVAAELARLRAEELAAKVAASAGTEGADALGALFS